MVIRARSLILQMVIKNMKRIFALSLGLAFLICMVVTPIGCSHSGGGSASPADRDSLYSMEHIQQVCFADPHQALALLDTAESRGLLSPIDIDGVRAMIYQNAFEQTNTALLYARRAYENPAIQGDTIRILKSLRALTSLSLVKSRYVDVMDYATEGARIAALVGDEMSTAYFLQFVGFAQGDMGDIDEAVKNINRSIEIYQQLLKANNSPGWDSYDNIIYGYSKEANLLIPHKRYPEALKALEGCETALKGLAECKDASESVVDERSAELYALYTFLYKEMGDKVKAREYYNRLMATEFGKSAAGADLAINYLLSEHQYDEALKRLALERTMLAENRDTITDYYINSLLASELVCLEGKGETGMALAKAKQIKTLTDSLYRREDASRLAEQATIYKINDIEMQLLESEQRLKRVRLVTAIVILSVVFVALVTFLTLYFRRKIRHKNRATVAMIDELASRSEVNNLETTDEATPEDEQQRLFEELNRRIVAEKLYLQPGFSRNQAAALIGIQPRQLSAMFRQFADGFPDYINHLRLDHSVMLLKAKGNYTIEAVAEECGFQSRQTFHRLFIDRYGMTPAEYRKTIR